MDDKLREELKISEQTSRRDLCEEFLYEIFQWDPLWLDDKKYEETPPPVIDSIEMIPTKLIYSTFEEYRDVMFPFLRHEFWFVLKEDFIEEIKNNKHPKAVKAHVKQSPYSSRSVNNDDYHKISELSIITTIKNYENNENKYPNRGDLVIVKSLNDKRPVTFGFISNVDLKGITYTLKSKFCSRLQLPSQVELTTVTWVSAHITLIEALCYIPYAELMKPILQPEIEYFKISSVLKTVETATKEVLNEKQAEIMSRIIETVKRKSLGIFLIQGPPGCGKSSVIKNIIATIMKNGNEKRVLVCAPSNKAIDELVLKLLDIQPLLEEQKVPFKIVRLGREDKMNASVKRIYLSNLRYNARTDKFYYYPRRKNEKRDAAYEEFILKKANIITCTLTSSYTSYRMRSVFGRKFEDKLPFCIIDEAAQATELLTLVPVMLDIDKLILVGDPQQLPPTVLSQKAKDYGYDSSLFARAQTIFDDEPEENPIVMLDTQYRMMDSISQWPNRYFYKGLIKNAASVAPLDFCNYKLLNHSFVQVEDAHSNPKEAILVANLVSKLVEEIKLKYPDRKISIGVITPYKDQYKLINSIINPCKKKTQQMKPQKILKRPDQQNDKNIIVKEECENVDNENINEKNSENYVDDKDVEKEKFFEENEDNDNKSVELNDNVDDQLDEDSESNESEDIKILNDTEKVVCADEKRTETKKNKKRNQDKNKCKKGKKNNVNDDKSSEKKEDEKPQKIQVNTVDSFQGSECDIIIMSCVRSEGIGFVKDPNRLNVSLTRAKHSLIMCGNFNTFRRDEMWESLLNDAQSREVYFDLTKDDELKSIIEHVIINRTSL
ncbi:probable helicase senataxin isoform X2 [Cotesia glomerata]|uniref:probable helicase senataxin isoform X2 n=1 Tax=Cotesia glomerata TaxID=32391 RepID=UPI001D01AB76|nr:probable helicase senataxin isoform X2 [Cotesia glomerata]